MQSLWFIFINILFINISYPIVDIYLSYNYNKYSSYDERKKNYIKKNFIKSRILYYISIATIPIIPSIFLNIYGFSNIYTFFGCLYVAGDTVALFKNIKISNTTKYHHIVTTLFGFINCFINWDYAGIIPKLMALYMMLSSYSFHVNKCLALRFLIGDEEAKKERKKAFIVYLLSCVINWTIHISVFIYNIKNMRFSMSVYFLLILIIAYDDVILLKWLCN